jgi:hypothetical protein
MRRGFVECILVGVHFSRSEHEYDSEHTMRCIDLRCMRIKSSLVEAEVALLSLQFWAQKVLCVSKFARFPRHITFTFHRLATHPGPPPLDYLAAAKTSTLYIHPSANCS